MFLCEVLSEGEKTCTSEDNKSYIAIADVIFHDKEDLIAAWSLKFFTLKTLQYIKLRAYMLSFQ